MCFIWRLALAAQPQIRLHLNVNQRWLGRGYCCHESNNHKKFTVVMVRHGESEWNERNLFSGWYDAPLNMKGLEEACAAGKAIKDAKLKFDIAHTSLLSRAQDTLFTVLDVSGQSNLPIWMSWRLNERHYGGLTGLNKAETAKIYGEEQVKVWRRSFDTAPPPMEKNHKYYKCIAEDPRYKNIDPRDFPNTESLKLTIDRCLPYWEDIIVPQIYRGARVLIAAHGNTLRGIVKHLEYITDEAILKLNLPTGIPFLYELDEDLIPLAPLRFLGDPEMVKKAMKVVANQGKVK